MTKQRQINILALGGNLPSHVGSPCETLKQAVIGLSSAQIDIKSLSRFFKTPCFPAGAGPDYVNAVALVRSTLEPAELLARLHEIEAGFGRNRLERWGMRTLDIDLIGSGQSVLPDLATYSAWRDLSPDDQANAAPDRLVLPHPRIQDRAFVLVPLCDVAPTWRHPVLGITAAEMRDRLPKQDIEAVKPL